MGVGPCAQRPTPAQDLGRSFPPKGSPPPTLRGSGSHACVPLGPGEGVVRGVSWLLGDTPLQCV